MKSSRFRIAAVALTLTLALGACGLDMSTDRGGGEVDPASTGFPVTIDHLFGSTTIKTKPQRIVAIGGGDMETAIALGAIPVAGADWFGSTELRSWVKDALGDRPAPKLVQSFEPKFEEIAALKPDLILYVNSINDKTQYETFSGIAPTIAAPAGTKSIYGVAWQQQVQSIAKATGTVPEGEKVIQETEGLLTDAAKANPEFRDKTITAGVFSADKFSAWLPSDPRMRLLTSLGFKTNPQIDALDNGDFYISLSGEQLEKMNADVILLAAQDQNGKIDPGVTKNAVFNNLATVKAKHVAYFGGAPVINSNSAAGQFSSAFSIGGPLGIKYVISKIGPLLKPAITGQS